MHERQLGPLKVSAPGLGCMSMSQAYGKPDRAESERALHRALDIGYTFLDTPSVYGMGNNETLIGEVLKHRRKEFARRNHCTAAQLSLAWVLAQGENFVPIPGTKHVPFVEENAAAADLAIDPADLVAAGEVFSRGGVLGDRYAQSRMISLDPDD